MSPDGNLSSRSGHFLSSSNSTSQSVNIGIEAAPRARRASTAEKAIQNAVYTHIQAVRALGRESINTVEIAQALGITVDAANEAIAGLKKRGAKIS